ncbi:MAG: hypothetical protein AAF437_03585 [Pseudomonadota bacterium]
MRAGEILKYLTLSFLAFMVGVAAMAQHAEETPDGYIQLDDINSAQTPISAERVDRALAVLEADDELQTTRPEWNPDPAEFPEQQTRRPNAFVRAIAAFFRAIGGVLGYLLAAIILIAILAGLYMVFGESLTLRGRQRDKPAGTDVSNVPDLRPEATRARALLKDADALAAEGRFAEAVHLLLFRSIDDIQEKKSGIIGRSLTAREIGALGILPDWIRDALSPIIRIVERSFFGGQDVNESAWQVARSSYQTFAFGKAWS